jgi:hypothetical protein
MTTEPDLALVPRGDMVRVLRKQTYYAGLRKWVDIIAFGLIALQVLMTAFITEKGGASFAAFGFLAALYPIVAIVILRMAFHALVDIADALVELRLKSRRAGITAPPTP